MDQSLHQGSSPRRDEAGVCRVVSSDRLSHAAILLPGLVHHRGLRRVQGRGQRAQKTRQQGQAQAAPRAEHGPAVPVADVLRDPEHVAREAGQLEVDAGHARAE